MTEENVLMFIKEKAWQYFRLSLDGVQENKLLIYIMTPRGHENNCCNCNIKLTIDTQLLLTISELLMNHFAKNSMFPVELIHSS